ncbi:MAG: SUMF1/EgtB/PvdO family nonheme iron enzyme [Bacteroidota bacterium]|nr:SUMF1/EgtB/PvdO family nonheme iron enzyme [Bacteroidota bacterium]
MIRIVSSIMILFFHHTTSANNLNISTPLMTGRNAASNFVLVKFNISWENSWKISSAPNNWDAAWVFVKFKVGSGEWQHATISSSGHIAPSGSIITPSPDGKGIFMYRSVDGSGTANFSGVKLQWNYGIDGVNDDDQITVKVFGIEMVYVTQGDFWLGSAAGEPGTLMDGAWPGSGDTDPFDVTSEGVIQLGHIPGKLWAKLMSPYNDDIGDTTVPIPAIYPKGWNDFYCMKYSITQEQYVDFLNTLTYTQQVSRTERAPNSAAGTLVMMSNGFLQDRNSIRVQTPGSSPSTPATYGCDLDGNATFDDGKNIGCNYLSWGDGTAYMDWAGLRPMSELEFEKACRGTDQNYVWDERSYANRTVAHVGAVNNSGFANETYALYTDTAHNSWNLTINGASNINAGWPPQTLINGSPMPSLANMFDSPVRAGIFATDTSNRTQSGATYYGIMEMSGDLWERAVNISTAEGKAFQGTHGNGVLSAGGSATNTDWPDTTGQGSGFRGGNFSYDSDWSRVSDRDLATHTVSTRYETISKTYSASGYGLGNFTVTFPGYRGTFGFRGVRTAP